MPHDPILEGLKKARAANPDVQADVVPYNVIDRLLSNPNATAVTDPFTGTIRYNPETIGKVYSPQNTFAHELQHSRNFQNLGYMDRVGGYLKKMFNPSSYEAQEDEIEAQNIADMQEKMKGDIELPASRGLRNAR